MEAVPRAALLPLTAVIPEDRFGIFFPHIVGDACRETLDLTAPIEDLARLLAPEGPFDRAFLANLDDLPYALEPKGIGANINAGANLAEHFCLFVNLNVKSCAQQ